MDVVSDYAIGTEWRRSTSPSFPLLSNCERPSEARAGAVSYKKFPGTFFFLPRYPLDRRSLCGAVLVVQQHNNS